MQSVGFLSWATFLKIGIVGIGLIWIIMNLIGL